MSVLRLYFGWPAGAVYSNLLASAICAALVWWRLRARMILHHAEHLAETERRHLEHLAQAEQHHADLREHITAATVRPTPRAAKTLVKPAKGEKA